MKRITQKLKSQSGASFLIALVGFLAAAMISAVIVAAALTSAQRVENDKVENQTHLTLESAAQLLRDEIESTDYAFSDYTGAGNIDTGTASVTGTFKAEMKDAVEYVDLTTGSSYKSGEHSTDFTVTQGSGISSVVKDVNVSFEMYSGEDQYDVVYTLTVDGSDRKIYISADGYCTENKDASGLYHITWTVVSINGLEG